MKMELMPVYDTRKSFYRKAIIEKGKLYSYDTLVASYEDGVISLHNTRLYSATTLRHVKEFIKQLGFEAGSKKQLLEAYKEV